MAEATLEQFQAVADKNLRHKLSEPSQKRFDHFLKTGQINLPDFFGSGVLEPLAAVGTGVTKQIGSGIVGGLSALVEGGEKATERIENIQGSAFSPKTKSGREGMENLGKFVQTAIDTFNFPVSGIAGLIELATGQGIDQAGETVASLQEEGIGETLSERIFEETGSPALAAGGKAFPEVLGSRFGVKRTPSSGQPNLDPAKIKDIDTVLKAGKESGVDVLTSDIFPPKQIFSRLSQQFAERIPVVGTGGRRAKQHTQRIKALEDLDLAVPSVDSVAIFKSLEDSVDRRRVAAGNRLNEFQTRLNFEANNVTGPVPTVGVTKSIDAAIERLTRVGKLPDKPLLKSLEELRETATTAGIDFKSLRDFRTDISSMAEKVDAAGNSQLRSSDKASVDRIRAGITRDLDSYVLKVLGKAELRRYKQADDIYRQEARKLTKSGIKNILDKGDVHPELINNLLFSSTPSQINLLFKNLNTDGRANARISLYRRALDNAGKSGTQSPAKFISELNKLKPNFDVFFRDGGKAELNGLKRLLQSTQRADAAGVVTPTGQGVLFTAAAGTGAAAATGSASAIASILLAGTIGLGSRLFNSSLVRDSLIKLGKAKKGSKLEVDLLKSIPIALQEANKTLEREQQLLQQPEN